MMSLFDQLYTFGFGLVKPDQTPPTVPSHHSSLSPSSTSPSRTRPTLKHSIRSPIPAISDTPTTTRIQTPSLPYPSTACRTTSRPRGPSGPELNRQRLRIFFQDSGGPSSPSPTTMKNGSGPSSECASSPHDESTSTSTSGSYVSETPTTQTNPNNASYDRCIPQFTPPRLNRRDGKSYPPPPKIQRRHSRPGTAKELATSKAIVRASLRLQRTLSAAEGGKRGFEGLEEKLDRIAVAGGVGGIWGAGLPPPRRLPPPPEALDLPSSRDDGHLDDRDSGGIPVYSGSVSEDGSDDDSYAYDDEMDDDHDGDDEMDGDHVEGEGVQRYMANTITGAPSASGSRFHDAGSPRNIVTGKRKRLSVSLHVNIDNDGRHGSDQVMIFQHRQTTDRLRVSCSFHIHTWAEGESVGPDQKIYVSYDRKLAPISHFLVSVLSSSSRDPVLNNPSRQSTTMTMKKVRPDDRMVRVRCKEIVMDRKVEFDGITLGKIGRGRDNSESDGVEVNLVLRVELVAVFMDGDEEVIAWREIRGLRAVRDSPPTSSRTSRASSYSIPSRRNAVNGPHLTSSSSSSSLAPSRAESPLSATSIKSRPSSIAFFPSLDIEGETGPNSSGVVPLVLTSPFTFR